MDEHEERIVEQRDRIIRDLSDYLCTGTFGGAPAWDILNQHSLNAKNRHRAGLDGLGRFFPGFATAIDYYARGQAHNLIAAVNLLNVGTLSSVLLDQGSLAPKDADHPVIFRQNFSALASAVDASSESISSFNKGFVTLLGVHAYQRSTSSLELLVDKDVLQDVHRCLLPLAEQFLAYQESQWDIFDKTIFLCPERPSLGYSSFIRQGTVEVAKTYQRIVQSTEKGSVASPLDLIHPDTFAFCQRLVEDNLPRSEEFQEAREALAHYHRQWAAEEAASLYR